MWRSAPTRLQTWTRCNTGVRHREDTVVPADNWNHLLDSGQGGVFDASLASKPPQRTPWGTVPHHTLLHKQKAQFSKLWFTRLWWSASCLLQRMTCWQTWLVPSQSCLKAELLRTCAIQLQTEVHVGEAHWLDDIIACSSIFYWYDTNIMRNILGELARVTGTPNATNGSFLQVVTSGMVGEDYFLPFNCILCMDHLNPDVSIANLMPSLCDIWHECQETSKYLMDQNCRLLTQCCCLTIFNNDVTMIYLLNCTIPSIIKQKEGRLPNHEGTLCWCWCP